MIDNLDLIDNLYLIDNLDYSINFHDKFILIEYDEAFFDFKVKCEILIFFFIKTKSKIDKNLCSILSLDYVALYSIFRLLKCLLFILNQSMRAYPFL